MNLFIYFKSEGVSSVISFFFNKISRVVIYYGIFYLDSLRLVLTGLLELGKFSCWYQQRPAKRCHLQEMNWSDYSEPWSDGGENISRESSKKINSDRVIDHDYHSSIILDSRLLLTWPKYHPQDFYMAELHWTVDLGFWFCRDCVSYFPYPISSSYILSWAIHMLA